MQLLYMRRLHEQIYMIEFAFSPDLLMYFSEPQGLSACDDRVNG
jgi:hypothetical protein